MLKVWNFTELNLALKDILGSAAYFLPELALAGFLLVLIVLDLVLGDKRKPFIYGISVSALLITFLFLSIQAIEKPDLKLFVGMLTIDGMAVAFKLLFTLAGFMAVLLTFSRRKSDWHESSEYHSLLIGALLGTLLMVMTTNFLMLYLSIELVSICSYILANFSHKKKSAESGLKYFLFGALSSGIMLYGISLLYGFTGSLDFSSAQFMNGLEAIDTFPLFMAAFMVISGFLFKISAVPFHIWTPDVYEGTPTPIVAFFSVAPKLAGIAVLIRFLGSFEQMNFLGLQGSFNGYAVLVWLAILTMTVGNFSALWQKNAKRMMAYSSIGHAGLFLAAVLAFSELGIKSILFYGVVYLLMNFAAFLLIQLFAERKGVENIEDFAGLGQAYPFIGAVMVVVMISLTGLPPTAGFTAKFMVFSALLQTYQEQGDPMVMYLIIAGLLNTIVSLFYYLKIPYQMFFKEGKTNREKMSLNLYDKALTVMLTLPLLWLFFQSGWLINLLNHIKYLF